MSTVVYKIYFSNPRTGDIIDHPEDRPKVVYTEKYFRRYENRFLWNAPPGYILQPKRMVLRTTAIKKRFHIVGLE